MDELDEVLGEFLIESYENLDRLDQDLVALEDSPTDGKLLAGIFRTIHTIKGTCGFLGFPKLEALTHAGENLLSKLRDGELALNPAITSGLLAMVDAVREMLNSIEASKTEGDGDYSALTQRLHDLLETSDADAASAHVPQEDLKVTSSVVEEQLSVEVDAPPTTFEANVNSLPQPAPKKAESDSTPAVNTPSESLPTPAPVEAGEPAAASHGNAGDSTIRVDVSLLDTLMNLVGELVLARNQIVQVTSAYGEADMQSAAQRLNLITSELQEGVMKTRMQPIGNVLSKFPRIVRDIALSLGKQVNIELEGKETELDKTINEAIKDPLTHLVRNSVDHGLELPEVRIANGKPAEGRVVLRAFHEGGQVNIEIQDDGAGIDHNKIKAKALEKRLITQAQAERMTEREALQLIFLPGFSTAEKITNVSGRGVGMDVVKTNIESIGGSVDVQTVIGAGTTFKIKIPLTLAIIPALLVSSMSDRYAIPQVSLLELVRLEGADALAGIEMIHGAPVYRLRGSLLPLCHLGHELSGADVQPWSGPSAEDRVVNIVVLQADGRQFGLVVDDINDTQEIVVKPLDAALKGISALAGATIMGDGRVALILDVLGLAHKAHVISEHRDRALAEAQAGLVSSDSSSHLETLLLARAGDRRIAVPLALVSRLEEFPQERIEMANGHLVVQYRNGIMPLCDVASMLNAGFGEASDGASSSVIVYSSGSKSLGLKVDTILDIVQGDLAQIDEEQSDHGIRGSVVVDGKVTDILDIAALVECFDPHFFATTATNEEAASQ